MGKPEGQSGRAAARFSAAPSGRGGVLAEDDLLDEPNREVAAYQLRFERRSRRLELR